MLGTVGPISTAEIADSQLHGRRRRRSSVRSGLEWQYDQFLRGQDGYDTVKVNSNSQFEDGAGKAPTPGDNLRTSLNLPLQKAGMAALEQSIERTPRRTVAHSSR